jgi:hypothetical protein
VEKTTLQGALGSVLTKYQSGDVKKTEMGRACSTHGEEMCIQDFNVENLWE